MREILSEKGHLKITVFQCRKGSCNPCFYEESLIKYFFLSLLSVSLEASLHILFIMLQDDVLPA